MQVAVVIYNHWCERRCSSSYSRVREWRLHASAVFKPRPKMRKTNGLTWSLFRIKSLSSLYGIYNDTLSRIKFKSMLRQTSPHIDILHKTDACSRCKLLWLLWGLASVAISRPQLLHVTSQAPNGECNYFVVEFFFTSLDPLRLVSSHPALPQTQCCTATGVRQMS